MTTEHQCPCGKKTFETVGSLIDGRWHCFTCAQKARESVTSKQLLADIRANHEAASGVRRACLNTGMTHSNWFVTAHDDREALLSYIDSFAPETDDERQRLIDEARILFPHCGDPPNETTAGPTDWEKARDVVADVVRELGGEARIGATLALNAIAQAMIGTRASEEAKCSVCDWEKGFHSPMCSAEKTEAESVPLDYKLPCDVRIPPATTFGRGVTLRTLMHGLRMREGKAEDVTRFADERAQAVADAIKRLSDDGSAPDVKARLCPKCDRPPPPGGCDYCACPYPPVPRKAGQ